MNHFSWSISLITVNGLRCISCRRILVSAVFFNSEVFFISLVCSVMSRALKP